MKPVSIRLRLAGWYCAVLLLGLTLFGAGMWYVLQLRLVAGVDERLAHRIEGLRNALGAEAEIHDEDQLRRELAEFSGEVSDGSVVQLQTPSGARVPGSPRQPVLRSAAAPGTFSTVSVEGRAYRLAAAGLDTAGRHYGMVVAVPLDEVSAVMTTFRYLLLLMIPGVLVLAGLGGYWLSSRALRPVDRITSEAESIGVQDLSRRIEVPRTGDELQRMAEVWNAMLERLEGSVQRIRQFTADASHELRTPLALIRTTAELGLRRERSVEEYRQCLRDVVAEASRMTQLTESLLSLARGDNPGAGMEIAPRDLGEIVGAVVAEYAVIAAEKGLRLESSPQPHRAVARVDAGAIRRLLRILLDNAVRHTPPGGSIAVAAEEDDSSVCLSVKDSGEGIAPEALPHIFERFYRADAARGGDGFGLGLSIAQAIARAHGSELQAESSVGKGARFHVLLRRETK